MQTILLLAGDNTRMHPLDGICHKSMMKLYGKPILDYIVKDLHDCGISDFIFVTGNQAEEIHSYFGDGSKHGISIKYAVQEKPNGQGDGLLKAKPYVSGPFIVINPYHLAEKELFNLILKTFQSEKPDGIIPAVFEKDISHYGALIVDNQTIKGIVEKPAPGEEPSNFRATSAYILNKDFFDCLEKIPPQHYSFEAAINEYVKSHTVTMLLIDKKENTVSLKYPWHLLQIRKSLSKTIKGNISPSAVISPNAVVDKTVVIDDGAVIHDFACIKGNTYIGKNAMIGNHALIRDCDIGNSVQLGAFSDVTRSVIMQNTHSHGSGFIGDSIIGPNNRLAYGFTTANKRIDRSTITSFANNKKVDTSLTSLGVITGANVKTGIYVSVMPGVSIGENCVVGPGVILSRTVQKGSSLFVKQTQEVSSLSEKTETKTSL